GCPKTARTRPDGRAVACSPEDSGVDSGVGSATGLATAPASGRALLAPFGLALDVPDDGPGGGARGPPGPKLAAVLHEGGPRHVEVGPGNVPHELLQEQPGGDGAAPPDAHVLHVGHGGLDVPPVVGPQGELPTRLPLRLAGG